MHSRLRSLLIPDLALTGAGVTLLFALVLFGGGTKLFRDADTGWHIRNGESILATHALPRVDPYSWSLPAQPWFAWEWGADVIMGRAHRYNGLAAVAGIYFVLIAACTWLWFRLHWIVGSDFLLACAMASPMLSTVNLHWLARPHVFGWVLLLVSVLWLDKLRAGAGWRGGAVAFGLAVLWANLHASFFLLPGMALVYTGSCILRPWLWREIEAPPEHARAFAYLAAAGGAAMGTLVNPYGWRLHEHVARYLTNGELLARIGEFQTFNFHSDGAGQILLTVALGGAGAVLALGQRKLAHFFLLSGFTLLAIRSARALPLLALLLPLAGGAIAQALRPSAMLAYSANLRKIDARFSGLVWVPVLMLCAFGAKAEFPAQEFPVAAAAVLPAEGRLLAPDKFGGYLIYRFAGRRKVFFDGRSDYYGVEFMRDYIELVQVRPGFERHLERFGFTHALLPPDYTLVAVLPKLGWREMYRDKTAVLLAATNPNGAGLK